MKTLLIKDEVHTALKLWCAARGKLMTEVVAQAIINAMQAPEEHITTVTMADLVKAPETALKRENIQKNKFTPCAIEIGVAKINLAPDREDYRANPNTLEMRFDPYDVWFEPKTPEAAILTALAMSTRKTQNMLSGDLLPTLLRFHGMESEIEVEERAPGEFYPANMLAEMIMALQPGRTSFNKYAIHMLAATDGARIAVKYIDN